MHAGEAAAYCPKWRQPEYRNYEERKRLTCSVCKYILYENPVVGVAVIVLNKDGRILLGKRSGSYKGLWCIPCGYVEYDEDVFDAAAREFKEETGLDVKIKGFIQYCQTFTTRKLIRSGSGLWLRLPEVN